MYIKISTVQYIFGGIRAKCDFGRARIGWAVLPGAVEKSLVALAYFWETEFLT